GLLEAASPPLQYRAYAEVVRESDRDPERLAALRQAVLEYKVAQAIARKQKSTGLWGGNLLGPVASKAHGWSEPGTVYQYRRLIELGSPPTERPFRLADRMLFQLLSRDRKSTRLNSSPLVISYAVFCLKKKNSSTTHCCSHLRSSSCSISNS